MAINFTFSTSGTSRFAQVIGGGAPKCPVGYVGARYIANGQDRAH